MTRNNSSVCTPPDTLLPVLLCHRILLFFTSFFSSPLPLLNHRNPYHPLSYTSINLVAVFFFLSILFSSLLFFFSFFSALLLLFSSLRHGRPFVRRVRGGWGRKRKRREQRIRPFIFKSHRRRERPTPRFSLGPSRHRETKENGRHFFYQQRTSRSRRITDNFFFFTFTFFFFSAAIRHDAWRRRGGGCQCEEQEFNSSCRITRKRRGESRSGWEDANSVFL
ncbi:hypothetical protein CSUI_009869 [Cystoisospora suis]|uniref:Transmembrane protein n=1 Tax=Cystoisospora suis TaxID=483139 RepID=A0A2C6KFL1_9APIC|nr:hypothetical protein CSUI_009869 [Cystoisospora suis]